MRSRIYLSGPLEQADDAATWRDKINEDHAYYNFVNPLENIEVTVEEMNNNPRLKYYVVYRCIREVILSEGILINWSKPEITWGTPIEQYIAWMNGIPNVVYTGDDDVYIPAFMQVFADQIYEDRDKALSNLGLMVA